MAFLKLCNPYSGGVTILSLCKNLRGGSLIDDPKGMVRLCADPLRREPVELLGRAENLGEDVFFTSPEQIKSDVRGAIDAGVGEGHAPGVLFSYEIGGDKSLGFLQRGRMGKERGGMSVFTHPEHHEIKRLAFEGGLDGLFVSESIV